MWPSIQILRKYFEIRENPKGATPNYDTFIFYIKKNEKRKILKRIKVSKFGTKNLPDAIKWHCSAYWNYALPPIQINKSLKTKKLLLNAVAIPINLTRKLKDYKKLAENIVSIK